LGETTRRYTDVEVVYQGKFLLIIFIEMPMEVSYRYSKLYPIEAKDFTKRASDSPFVENKKRKTEFSDYFQMEETEEEQVKEFASVIKEDVKGESPSQFVKSKNMSRSSSVNITRASTHFQISYGANLNHKYKNVNKEGEDERMHPNFMSTFNPKKSSKSTKNVVGEISLKFKKPIKPQAAVAEVALPIIKKQGMFIFCKRFRTQKESGEASFCF
jgi:hypothetical protein